VLHWTLNGYIFGDYRPVYTPHVLGKYRARLSHCPGNFCWNPRSSPHFPESAASPTFCLDRTHHNNYWWPTYWYTQRDFPPLFLFFSPLSRLSLTSELRKVNFSREFTSWLRIQFEKMPSWGIFLLTVVWAPNEVRAQRGRSEV